MMNRLKTLACSALTMIVVTVSAPAAEPGKKDLTINFSAIGAATPYVAFGEADPGGRIGLGARIALGDKAELTLGYSLLIEPSGTGDPGDLAPAHSLTLGFDLKF